MIVTNMSSEIFTETTDSCLEILRKGGLLYGTESLVEFINNDLEGFFTIFMKYLNKCYSYDSYDYSNVEDYHKRLLEMSFMAALSEELQYRYIEYCRSSDEVYLITLANGKKISAGYIMNAISTIDNYIEGPLFKLANEVQKSTLMMPPIMISASVLGGPFFQFAMTYARQLVAFYEKDGLIDQDAYISKERLFPPLYRAGFQMAAIQSISLDIYISGTINGKLLRENKDESSSMIVKLGRSTKPGFDRIQQSYSAGAIHYHDSFPNGSPKDVIMDSISDDYIDYASEEYDLVDNLQYMIEFCPIET